MRPTRRTLAALPLALSAMAIGSRIALAWPERPIRLIIPGPPGGAADIMARLLSDEVSRRLGQPLMIEPRPGAGGNLAAEFVAKAPADGHTLLFGDVGPLAINPTLFGSLSYDPLRDFEPIAQVALFPWVVAVHPSVEARTLQELFALARRMPGGLAYATPGVGTPMHLTGAILKEASGAEFTHVPYRGGGPATTDLIGGQVKVGILGLPPAAPHLQSGAIRGIGVSTAARAASRPDVPTLQEGGLAGFDASVWYGVLAPRATPRDVIARINGAFGHALELAAVRTGLAQRGVIPTFSSPEAFRALIEGENARWAPVVRASGARVE
jgi:tripartite-type tricarboxylate transporter receptor subunit TctC